MGRFENAEVFRDTERMCRENARLREAMVLGAFGCGAFRNDPKVVATAAKKVVAEYRHAFRAIEFAVYCRPGDTANYDAFAAVENQG